MGELFVVNGICCGTVFAVKTKVVTVGRTPECDIQIADPWISSRHARFERRDGRQWLIDHGSRNGTFVDDVAITETLLEDGAVIRFGKTEADYREAAATSEEESWREPTMVDVAPGPHPLARCVEPTMAPTGGSPPPIPLAADLMAKRQVALLDALGKELLGAGTPDATLKAVLSTVAGSVRAFRAGLLVTDGAGGMVPRVSINDKPPKIVKGRIRAVMSQRTGVISIEGRRDPNAPSTFVGIPEEPRACMHVPVWADNRILGIFVLERQDNLPFSGADLELITAASYHMALALERATFLEKAKAFERERTQLLRHISPDVAKEILSKPVETEEDEQQTKPLDDVTVLFSDIKGFTGMTEHVGADELGILLNKYFAAMTEEIFREYGTLDKFIGDGLMAVFGAPVPQRNAAIRAVRCAWRMRQRLVEVNAHGMADRQIRIRIGINTGKVIAGTFGSRERKEYTVLGDTVNIASRLESIATPGAVYVGKLTAEKASAAFEFRNLGERQVKGKISSVHVYELVGPKVGTMPPPVPD
jgi:adenylate cyclase